MSWIVTADGHEASLRFPTLDMFEIERIAHSLAQINRFNGHASRPYSVAEHSLLVYEIAKHMDLDCFGLMAALMHDAHEAFVGDVATPVKIELGSVWRDFEARMAHMTALKFGFHAGIVHNHAEIKNADLSALAIERYHLLPHKQPSGHPSTPWPSLAHLDKVHHFVDLNEQGRASMTWMEWRDAFIAQFQELQFVRAEAQHMEARAA